MGHLEHLSVIDRLNIQILLGCMDRSQDCYFSHYVLVESSSAVLKPDLCPARSYQYGLSGCTVCWQGTCPSPSWEALLPSAPKAVLPDPSQPPASFQTISAVEPEGKDHGEAKSTKSTGWPDGLAMSLLFQLRPDGHPSNGCHPCSGFTASQHAVIQPLCESLHENAEHPDFPVVEREFVKSVEEVLEHFLIIHLRKKDDSSLGDLRNGYDLTNHEFYINCKTVVMRDMV